MRLQDEVVFNVFLAEDDIREGMEFPPHRFRQRDDRLASLKKLWLGDFSEHLTLAKETVVINHFRNYSTQLANMLLMSIPEGNVSVGALFDAVVEQTAYGGCVLSAIDGEVQTIDPNTWYPLQDGSFYAVVPFISVEAHDSRPDAAEVWYFSEGGSVERAVYGWEGEYTGRGRLERLKQDWTNAGTHRSVVIPKLPTRGIWGTSKYIEIAAPTIEIANRGTRNSRVLDINGRPILTVTQAAEDAESQYDLSGDPDTDANARAELEKALARENAREVIHWSDTTQKAEFSAPNVEGVRVSLEQMEYYNQTLSYFTGMPDLEGSYQAPSGESLKREFLPLYAETSAMQNALVEGLLAIGVEVTWPHIFDVMEGDAERDDGSPTVQVEDEF